MDKLQPLIKHRYWICFGLSLIFVLAGWWMASGAIAVEILARKDAVEKSFEKAKQGVNDPNQFWVEAAKKENTKDEAAYKLASAQLLQRQKDARRWPDVLANDLKGIPYRTDVKDSTTRGRWASIYRDEIEKLLTIVKPYKNGEGLVVVDTSKITHKPFNSWRTAYPSSTEIWDAQEDIWLLQSLLTSIARVNEGATRITESQVRQISRLHLRGGDRDATPASAGGGGMMGGMGGDMGGMAMGMGAEMMGGAGAIDGGMGMGGAGGDGGKSHPGKEFEGSAGADILTEEFGPAGAAGGGAGLMGGAGGGGMGMGMEAMSMGAGGMGGAAAPVEEVRYVDDGADLGYKTRAFLLDVIVRDDQLPNLLASLTNSDFPVEIVRVEVVSRSAPRSAGGGMPGGMEGGMMSGMGGVGSGDMSDMGGGAGFGMLGDAGGDTGFGMVPEMPDAGVGPGAYGGGSGGYDGGAGYPGMMPGGSGVGGAQSKGKEALQGAMADPLLVMVKIGGLMTLYQSAQEADAQAATAETDQASAPEPAAPGELVPDETADPNMTDATGTPEGTLPAEGAAASADAASADAASVVGEGSPADTAPSAGAPAAGEAAAGPGSEPAAGTDPAAEPVEAPGSTPESPNPAEGDPGTSAPGTEPTTDTDTDSDTTGT
jgi:hypothetical protein